MLTALSGLLLIGAYGLTACIFASTIGHTKDWKY